jgi:electron transfer flavoprotein beta subunit
MRAVMPALMKAPVANIGVGGIAYEKTEVPSAKRDTVVKKNMSVDDIAKEIVDWIRA